MLVQRCYQYRLNPTPLEEQRFLQFAGCRRVVWNWALERRKEVYQATGKSLSYADLCKELTLLKQSADYAYLQEANSQALQQVLRDLLQAFSNCFKNRKHFRFPRWKTKRNTPNSFRIPQRVVVQAEKVFIPKVGWICLVLHQPLRGDIKSATVKQQPNGKWNITFVS